MSYNFYGWENALVPPINNDFKGIDTPQKLYDALTEIWCEYTCAPRLRIKWSKENITLGQCAITAFLAPRPKGNYHCYNVVGDVVFDLTSEQFGDEILDYTENPEQFREVHFSKTEKHERYEYLKAKLKEYTEHNYEHE